MISPPHGNPPEVVVVGFTTWKSWKDQSCIIEPGEHPSLPNRSVVSYEYAAIVRVGELTRMADGGKLEVRESVGTALMERIWDGARVTRLMPEVCRDFLKVSGTPL